MSNDETQPKKKSYIKYYADGAYIRLHNKSITVLQRPDYVVMKLKVADKDANTPACWHISHKNKVRETNIKMSKEAMDALMHAWLKYNQLKITSESKDK